MKSIFAFLSLVCVFTGFGAELQTLKPLTLSSFDYLGSQPRSLTYFQGRAYFLANDGDLGWHVWQTDGTSEGTVPVLYQGERFDAAQIISHQGTLYFLHSSTRELLVLDHPENEPATTGIPAWSATPGPQGLYLRHSAGQFAMYSPLSGYLALSEAFPNAAGVTPGVSDLVYFEGAHYVAVGGFDNKIMLLRLTEERTEVVHIFREEELITGLDFRHSELAVSNGTLYITLSYRTDDGMTGEIWSTDGTTEGMQPLAQAVHNDYFKPLYASLTPFGNDLMYTAYSLEDRDWTLHRATATATEIMPQQLPRLSERPQQLTAHDESILFLAESGLFRIDQSGQLTLLTSASAINLADRPYPGERGLVKYENGLYHFAAGLNYANHGVWVTDGTIQGTQGRFVGQTRFSGGGQEPIPFKEGYLYFNEYRGDYDIELFSLSEQGPNLLKEINPHIRDRDIDTIQFNDRLFYVDPGTREFMVSDGTFEGTLSLNSDLDIHSILGATDDLIYVYGLHPDHGWELWVSDGNPEGTRMVVEMGPGFEGLTLGKSALSGSYLYFFANDNGGDTLWRTDGSAQGTIALQQSNIYNEARSLLPDDEGGVFLVETHQQSSSLSRYIPESNERIELAQVPYGHTMFSPSSVGGFDYIHGRAWIRFLEEDCCDIYGLEYFKTHLWTSDGTAEGTFSLLPELLGISDIQPYGDQVIFSVFGTEVGGWVITDGSEPFTGELLSLTPTYRTEHFPVNDDHKVFSISYDTLWVSDLETEAATQLLQLDSSRYEPVESMEIDGKTYLLLRDYNRWAIVHTDGTPEGTELSFSRHAATSSWAFQNDTLYLQLGRPNYPSGPGRLHAWDAETDEMVLVEETTHLATPFGMNALNDKLLFFANDIEQGIHLYSLTPSDDGGEEPPEGPSLNVQNWPWFPNTLHVSAVNRDDWIYHWTVDGGQLRSPDNRHYVRVSPDPDVPTVLTLTITEMSGLQMTTSIEL